MIPCASSRAFGAALSAGELTQLEWLDERSRDGDADALDFASAHFPRTDPDYVAHLKKLCADRRLLPASVSVDEPLRTDDVEREIHDFSSWIDVASGLGAPYVRLAAGPVVGPPPIAWRELVRALKAVCAHAKRRNVTLALEPGLGSLVDDASAAKRLLKECDSAWLRLALTSVARAHPAWAELTDYCVLLVDDGSPLPPHTRGIVIRRT